MGPVILVAAVALAVVAAVAWPLVRNRAEDAAATGGDDRRQALQDGIDQSLRAIREIDFDHKAGNLGDADFAELDAVERARAAELLRQRDLPEG
jgi:hypothetical protein